jgi:hypothetical protein
MDPISILLGLIDPIEKITEAIIKARADAENAQTAQEKIAADERVATLQARRDVLIKEAGVSRLNIIMRAGVALAVNIIIWKLLVWDKALGQWTHGHTDDLSPELWHVIMVVIGFYFLYEGAIGVSRIIKR